MHRNHLAFKRELTVLKCKLPSLGWSVAKKHFHNGKDIKKFYRNSP